MGELRLFSEYLKPTRIKYKVRFNVRKHSHKSSLRGLFRKDIFLGLEYVDLSVQVLF